MNKEKVMLYTPGTKETEWILWGKWCTEVTAT